MFEMFIPNIFFYLTRLVYHVIVKILDSFWKMKIYVQLLIDNLDILKQNKLTHFQPMFNLCRIQLVGFY